jgi:hypothetical protein
VNKKKVCSERKAVMMKQNKRFKFIALSAILTASVIFVLLSWGAGFVMGNDSPYNLYISAKQNETKSALIGTYDWSFRNKNIHVDSDHPINFDYQAENIVSVTADQQLILSSSNLNPGDNYEFNLERITVYRDGKPIEFGPVKLMYLKNGDLGISAPTETGEYVYVVVINFKNKGIVRYGFIVRVDMLTFDLAEIYKYKTSNVGDNSKVSAIASHLPVPDNSFRQQYISMETDEKPFSLTIFYEAESEGKYQGDWPIVFSGTNIEANSSLNALVVFSMIDNLDTVTFAFRNTRSSGILEPLKYDTSFTFQRTSFEQIYGDLAELSQDLSRLHSLLEIAGKSDNQETIVKPLMPEFTDSEVAEARAVVEEYFRAIAATDTEAILATMYPHENLTIESVNNGSVQLFGTETRTLLSINYDSQDEKRRSYRPSSHRIADENIIVFKVSFSIDYPLNDGGPWNEGIYDNWSMILVRDTENDPWLIYDQGY